MREKISVAIIPTFIKILVPGYRDRWAKRYSVMLECIKRVHPTLCYGDSDYGPWIESKESSLRLHGFWTEAENAEVFDILCEYFPKDLSKQHFRLLKDYINRFEYPHMRPDLRPSSGSVDRLWGFHGQHKDTIFDIDSKDDQIRLIRAFTPKNGEVFLDCGAFLGFGDIRMVADIPDGHVIAVEASKSCYDILMRNKIHNADTQITALHNGIWREAGRLDLNTGFAQSNSLVEDIVKGSEEQIVETKSVDEIVKELGLTKLSMISLTINGAEIEALEGSSRTLNELRPRVRLAGWYKRNGEPVSHSAVKQLLLHDYDTFIGPRNNVLAIPKEQV